MADMEPNYQLQSPDEERACRKCKNFTPKEDEEVKGDCFGHEVGAEGTCDFFEMKKG